MKTKASGPIITHTEILARAIRSIDAELADTVARYNGLLSLTHGADSYLEEATAHLSAKREAVKTLYRIETGADYD